MQALIDIRQATVSDALQIAFVQTESWKTTYRGIIAADFLNSLNAEKKTEHWQNVLSRNSNVVFVAEKNGKIVGFSCAGKSRENAAFSAELYAIYILKKFQGKQIGKQLFSETIRELSIRGFQSMFVCVLTENESKQFYKKLGGNLFATKEIEIGSRKYIENLYGWADIQALKNAL